MKWSILTLVSVISFNVQASSLMGFCSNPESNVIISQKGGVYDLSIMDRTNVPLSAEWYEESFALSGEANGTIIEKGVFKGCVELVSLKEDVSDPGLGYALWEMIVCKGDSANDKAFFDATQFQPSDYVYKCNKGTFENLKNSL